MLLKDTTVYQSHKENPKSFSKHLSASTTRVPLATLSPNTSSNQLPSTLSYLLSGRSSHCTSLCLISHTIDPKTRSHMISWMIEVTTVLRFTRKVFFYTIKLMDAFLKSSSKKFEDKHMLLIGVTCLYIAMKLEDPGLYTLNDLVKNLTQNTINTQHIKEMENQILHDLSFNIFLTTSYEVLSELSRSVSAPIIVQHTATIVLYLLLHYYDSSKYDDVTLAFASLVISARTTHCNDVSDRVNSLLDLQEQDMQNIMILCNAVYLFPRIFAHEISVTKFLKFEFTLKEKGPLFHYVDQILEQAQEQAHD